MRIAACSALLVASAFFAFPAVSSGQSRIACPAGQAVQGVDFSKRSLICVPVGSGSGALSVVDADGEYVGILISQSIAAREISGHWRLFPAYTAGFPEGGGVTFWYESADCTGTRYIIDDTQNLPRAGLWIGLGASATFYVEAPGSSTRKIISSYQNLVATGLDPECTLFGPSEMDVAEPAQIQFTTKLPWRIPIP